jgi:hypothetical protein
LETEFTTAEGAVRVIDCMPIRSELVLRLGYGHVVPWIREVGRRTLAFAGPDTLTLDPMLSTTAKATTWSPSSVSTRASTPRSG